MPCYRPIDAWYGGRTESGRRSIVFERKLAVGRHSALTLPCGRCIGCRRERTRQWAVRCLHEASQHEANSFLTLTYDDDHLPAGGTLVKHHLQDFFKRLRARLSPHKVRHFSCGEYGDKFARPHYHSLLFGFDFPDKIPVRKDSEMVLFKSPLLADLWPHGFSSIGDVSFDSAAYVASYSIKKRSGDEAFHHYMRLDESTGELFEVLPEFGAMSLKPGIGAGWLEKFGPEVRRDDAVLCKQFESKPPRYYDKLFDLTDPTGFQVVKEARKQAARKQADNNTWRRLLVREQVAQAKLEQKKRGYES